MAAKFYVYTLIDPRDLSVFYIGKGTAARSYAHTHKLDVRETDASPKARRVRQILDAGEEVIVNIIKRFEDEDVESILTFMIKVLDFNGFDLRSKVLEVDHLGKVVSIEHRGRK